LPSSAASPHNGGAGPANSVGLTVAMLPLLLTCSAMCHGESSASSLPAAQSVTGYVIAYLPASTCLSKQVEVGGRYLCGPPPGGNRIGIGALESSSTACRASAASSRYTGNMGASALGIGLSQGLSSATLPLDNSPQVVDHCDQGSTQDTQDTQDTQNTSSPGGVYTGGRLASGSHCDNATLCCLTGESLVAL
jgi:hypothetical protein